MRMIDIRALPLLQSWRATQLNPFMSNYQTI